MVIGGVHSGQDFVVSGNSADAEKGRVDRKLDPPFAGVVGRVVVVDLEVVVAGGGHVDFPADALDDQLGREALVPSFNGLESEANEVIPDVRIAEVKFFKGSLQAGHMSQFSGSSRS